MLQLVDNSFAFAPAHGGHSKQDICYLKPFHGLGKCIRMKNRNAVKPLAPQATVIVDKAEQKHSGIVPRRERQLLACIARPVNQHSFRHAAKKALSEQVADNIANHDAAH